MPRELQIWDRYHRLKALAIVKHASFRTNAFYAASYPAHDQVVMETFLETREAGFSKSDADQSVVAIVETGLPGQDGEMGKVLAWMRVKYPRKAGDGEVKDIDVASMTPEAASIVPQGGSEEEVNPLAQYNIPVLPTGSNLDLQLHMRKHMAACEAKHYNRETDFCVASLATDPAYQGQGLAKQLLKWVTDMADAEGKRVYLDSTPEGVPVYKKCGFQDVGGFVTMLPRDGTEVEYWIRCMVRAAPN